MRKFILLLLFAGMLIIPANAMEFTAPEVPEGAEIYMPDDPQTFTEGLWYIIRSAASQLQPSLTEAAGICLSLIAVTLLISVLNGVTESAAGPVKLAGTLVISVLLIQPANTLIRLGAETITTLSDYGRLLLPVLTGALAAQGGVTSSTALYASTAALDTVLSSVISRLVIPLLYVYLCLCIACNMVKNAMLKELRNFIKWAMTWCLKMVLYVFTGYLSVTRVISGTVDASTVKATKLAISGAVPVVGGLISDASETILISAGLMKSAVGTYGLLAIIAIWIGPFLMIGSQYLLLKITSAICSVISGKENTELISDFTGAMGMILAMTGTVCLLLLVSTVCFMKGVS